jgi:peptidoglycan/LPS O-acetylase OafA/YrhL
MIYVPVIGGRGIVLFAAGAVGSVLFGLLLYYRVDRPVQALRTSVKKQGLVLGAKQVEAASGI